MNKIINKLFLQYKHLPWGVKFIINITLVCLASYLTLLHHGITLIESIMIGLLLTGVAFPLQPEPITDEQRNTMSEQRFSIFIGLLGVITILSFVNLL